MPNLVPRYSLNQLPKNIPVILDNSLFLLPGAEVMFKIHDLAFKDAVDYSFKHTDRFVSIYNAATLESFNNQIATTGKIVRFKELDDLNYSITVKGVIRFKIIDKIKYNEVDILVPDYSLYTDDLLINKLIFKDRDSLNRTIEKYFIKTKNNIVDKVDIVKMNDTSLLSLLSDHMNFSKYERSKLLKANNREELDQFVTSILEYELAVVESYTEAKH